MYIIFYCPEKMIPNAALRIETFIILRINGNNDLIAGHIFIATIGKRVKIYKPRPRHNDFLRIRVNLTFIATSTKIPLREEQQI